MRWVLLTLTSLFVACSSSDNDDSSIFLPGDCSYFSSGNLIPGTGTGVNDATLWAENIASPFVRTRAIAKSQIYNPGGSGSANGDECAANNFNYPHRDTFCETRSANRDSYNCPKRTIHQGIDINAGTHETCLLLRNAKRAIGNGAAPEVANIIPIVATANGRISYIGSYTVDLKPDDPANSKFRYLHMNMRTLPIELGDFVKKGQLIGYYYDDFGGNNTTFHLHLELIAFINGRAQYVSPYASFIAAEQRTNHIPCLELG
ncbi:MAG: M23 family metallopeptidase [Granulosicoccus sp.]